MWNIELNSQLDIMYSKAIVTVTELTIKSFFFKKKSGKLKTEFRSLGSFPYCYNKKKKKAEDN